MLIIFYQSNFNGAKYPLSWVTGLSNGTLTIGTHRADWNVLLDAASYVGTSPLDLTLVQPAFIAVSFYKMFGLPTGLGALIIKKSWCVNKSRNTDISVTYLVVVDV